MEKKMKETENIDQEKLDVLNRIANNLAFFFWVFMIGAVATVWKLILISQSAASRAAANQDTINQYIESLNY
jgi:type IV secretory pathway component VirB8